MNGAQEVAKRSACVARPGGTSMNDTLAKGGEHRATSRQRLRRQ